MKTTLFTVTLLLASQFSNAQRFFEPTMDSWKNPNLSVETFKDIVISGYSETNQFTGMMTPTFHVTTISGSPINNFYVNYPDPFYLMDFTIRESNQSIILVGMTVSSPHKMIVSEVNFMNGAPIQTSLEYNYSGNSMIPHQVIHSDLSGQVTIVGTEVAGNMSSANFAFVPKTGFVLGLDINNFNSIIYTPIEMNTPLSSNADYDMLENITEVNGQGYFISGSCNGSPGEQNLLIMGVNYGGGITFSNIIDNTNSRFAGSSVMYNKPLNEVYVMANNSSLHQFQVAKFSTFGMPLGNWFSWPITTLPVPIGSGIDQNGFRLQQSVDNLITVGGYLSAPGGALPQRLTPFQITMRDDLAFLSAKVYLSDNNAPLSPSYFEENGNSVFINTPDIIAYNKHVNRTYLVNQNSNMSGFDLHVSSLLKPSKCEKAHQVTLINTPVNIIGSANYNPLPMYANPYQHSPINRPIMQSVLCTSIAPTQLVVSGSGTNATLAPNPAMDQLSIVLDDESIRDVVVYDMKGNLVLSQKATERTRNGMTLSVEKLDPGAYLMEITTEEGTVHHERFVKQ